MTASNLSWMPDDLLAHKTCRQVAVRWRCAIRLLAGVLTLWHTQSTASPGIRCAGSFVLKDSIHVERDGETFSRFLILDRGMRCIGSL